MFYTNEMEIGILSDSHVQKPKKYTEQKKKDLRKSNSADLDPNSSKEMAEYKSLLKRLAFVFQDVDHIIHTGDVCCKDFILDLENINSKTTPVSVVKGNMDEMWGINIWPRTLTLIFEGIKIGVAHRLEDFALFDPKDIRVFVYGHTHIPSIKEDPNGVLLINPGSVSRPKAPAKKKYAWQKPEPKPTVAILTIEDGLISSFIKRI